MKKKLIITCAVLLSAISFAQQKSSSLVLIGGVTDKNGLGFMVNYTYSSQKSNYEFAVLHSLFKDESTSVPIDYSTTTLNVGYLQTVFRNTKNSIALNLGAGVSGGYENIPENDAVVLESKSGFIVGGYAVLQADFYISDTFSILFRAQENYFAISTTGTFNPFISAGIKFNL